MPGPLDIGHPRFHVAAPVAVIAVLIASLATAPRAAAASTRLAAACGQVNLRTSPSTTATVKTQVPKGSLVTAVDQVTGGAWTTACTGATVSRATWWRISIIGTTSVASRYRVTYVYGATGLFSTVASGIYGSAITMDGLGNTQIGGPNGSPGRLVAQRFRATTSGQLRAVRLTFPNMNPGYAAGTGGTLNVRVETDDGTSGHFPSGKALAQTTVVPRDLIATTNWPLITFATPPTLTRGTLYHIVLRNTDPHPAQNFVSLDALWMRSPTSPRQPRFSNADWALLYHDSSWVERREYSPIMGLYYADGSASGLAYVYSDIASARTISGGLKARETFTVTGASRSVSSAAVRLRLVSGTAPLVVRLETAAGELIDQASISSSALAAPAAVWATVRFPASHILATGHAYDLVLSSTASYSIFAPYEGSAFGHWDPRTYFSDGRAQYNNGSGWANWGGRTDHDLQFYLR